MPYVYSHQALSSEGRAAKSLVGTQTEDRNRWLEIQMNTFTNWINEQLAKRGLKVVQLPDDFCDGVLLVELVEILRNEKCDGKLYRVKPTEIQMLMNAQMCLDALQEDGLKLVNIGSYDIIEGNSKLVLGLIWQLILRYQIARKTKIPPKKLMLTWIQAVIPELKISNFTSNWNDGIALSALVEYCQPGTFPNWKMVDPNDRLTNCERAIQVAKDQLGIPMVLSPEDISSNHLDELSCMTYLSYFVKEGAPGYLASLNHVKQLLPQLGLQNFKQDWNDGLALCQLVTNVGGKIPGWPHLNFNPGEWTKNLDLAINAARNLGVKPVISGQEMADNEVDHLAVMAYTAHLCNLPFMVVPKDGPVCRIEPLPRSNYFAHHEVNIDVLFLDENVKLTDIEAKLSGPTTEYRDHLIKRTVKGAVVSFVPLKPGFYQVHILAFGKQLKGSPVNVQVFESPSPIPPEFLIQEKSIMGTEGIVPLSFSGLNEPCAVGSIVEVVINAHGQSQGQVVVEAAGPSGKLHKCPVTQKGESYTGTFTPTEVGEWQIGILYDGEHIKGSPFSCDVFDANVVQVYGLDVGVVGQELKFNVNTSQAGYGDIKVMAYHHGRAIPSFIHEQGPAVYKVQFTPDGAGQYKIHIYFNNMEVKGSPFILDIVDASSVSVYGENLRMASVDRMSTFMIHAVGADSKDITVAIAAPSGKKKRAQITPIGDSSYRVEWKPVEAGEHYIDVRLYNQSVHDSPFTCNVGDPDLVTVRNMPQAIKHQDIGETHSFEIDASTAGSGNLEIMINGGRVPCRVRELGHRHYLANFVPAQPVTHVVEMRFNGESVRGSPWRVEFSLPTSVEPPIHSQTATTAYVLAPLSVPGGAYSPAMQRTTTANYSSLTRDAAITSEYGTCEIEGVGLKQGCLGKVASFEIGAKGIRSDDIQVKLTSPGGIPTPTKIIAARNGNFRCEYVPTEVGSYLLDICVSGVPVDASPFSVNAYAPHKVVIDPIPGGAVGKPVQFYVDATEAGKGQLEISVNDGQVPNSVEMEGPGRCLVTFIPETSGTYIINVTFNEHLVRGCPVRVEIHERSRIVGDSTSEVASSATVSAFSKRYSREGSFDRSQSPRLSSPTMVQEQQRHHFESKTATPQSFVLIQKQKNGSIPSETTETHIYKEKDTFSTSVPKPYKPYAKGVRDLTDSGEYRSEELVKKQKLDHDSIGKWYETRTTTTIEKQPQLIKETKERSVYAPVIDWEKKQQETIEKKEFESVTSYDEKRRFEPTDSAYKMTSYDEKRFEPTGSTYKVTSYDEKRRFEPTDTTYMMTSYDEKPRFEPTDTTHKVTSYYDEKRRFEPTSSTYMTTSYDEKSRFEPTDTTYKMTSYDEKGRFEPMESYKVASYDKERDKEVLGATVAIYGVTKEKSTMESARMMMDLEKRKREKSESSSSSEEEKEIVVKEEKPMISYEQRLKAWGTKEEPITTAYRREETTYITEQPQIIEEKRESTGRVAGAVAAFEAKRMESIDEKKSQSVSTESLESSGDREEKMDISEKRDVQVEKMEIVETKKEYEVKPETMVVTKQVLTKKSSSQSSNSSEEEKTRKEEKVVETYLTTQIIDVEKPNIDWSQVKVEGDIGVVRIGHDYKFVIDPLNCEKDQLKVVIMAPSKRELPAKISPKGKGYKVEFSPSEVGTHRIYIHVGDVAHPESPFSTKVYDPRKIIVSDIKGSTFPEPVKFTVDANKAGYGNLEIAIKDDSGIIIPSEVRQEPNSNAKFIVTFRPSKSGKYMVDVSFNQENLKGSPFTCEVKAPAPLIEKVPHLTSAQPLMVPSARLVQSSIDMIPAGQLASLTFRTEGKGELTGNVTSPNGQKVPCKILLDSDDCYRVEFEPKIVGDHNVSVRFADVDVQDSPFTCRVYDSSCIRVGEIPHGLIGKAVHFVVDASEAGVGNLEVAVNEGKIPSMAHSLGQHRYDISFVPREVEDHTISIKFNNQSVSGSPFSCTIVSSSNVTASGVGLERMPVKRPAQFIIDPQDLHLKEEPTVDVVDATGQEIKATVIPTEKGMFKVEYTPQNVGSHQITVMYGGTEISGSPFTAKAFDSSRVKLSPVEGNIVGRPANFYIDAAKAGAGNMEIIVSVDSRNVPNFVQAEGNAKFKVSFTPQEAKTHVVSVKFNGDSVPGSPTQCEVVEGGQWVVSGDGLKQALVGQTASFSVEQPAGAQSAECNVLITAPNEDEVTYDSSITDTGVLQVSFQPKIVGRYQIDISTTGQEDVASNYFCNVFDPSLVKVSNVGPGIQGNPVGFEVDTTQAGEGQPEAVVKSVNGQSLDCDVELTSNGAVYRLWFTPTQTGAYKIWLSFNGYSVGNDPLVCQVLDPTSCHVTGDGLRLAQVDRAASFVIELTDKILADDLSVKVMDASNQSVPCSIRHMSGSKFKAEYIAKQAGTHQVQINLAGAKVASSPYQVQAFDLSAVRVLQLKDGQVGKENKFTVDYTNAGKGALEIAVTQKAQKVHTKIETLKEGVAIVSFTPKKLGQHKVNVTFCGVKLPECPYMCQVHDSQSVRANGPGLLSAVVSRPTHFYVLMDGAGRGELDVTITASDGGAVPVKCFQQKDGNFRVEYTPTVTGSHNIEVTFADQPITGSPFHCEVIDVNGVQITSDLKTLPLRQEAVLQLNKKSAGKGELEVEITDPSNKPVSFETTRTSDGHEEYHFVPTSVGEHQADFTFAGYTVPGSPLHFTVEEMVTRPSASGEGLQRALVNERTSFVFDSKKTKGGLKVEIEGPHSKSKHTSNKTGDGLYEIGFTPIESGYHTVNIFWNNKPIHGSPFSVPVLDPSKVRVNGSGLDNRGNIQMSVNVEKQLSIDTTEAGPGKLRAEIRGPNGKIPLTCDELGYGKYKITFVPKTEGEHSLYLYYADMLVPASPVQGWAEMGGTVAVPVAMVQTMVQEEKYEQSEASTVEAADNHLRVVLRGEGLKQAKTKEETDFMIDGSDAGKGLPTCSLFGHKADIPVNLTHLGNNKWKATYMPLIAGNYQLEVNWNDRPVRGSPFKVNVGAIGEASKIRIGVETLKMGIVGDELKTTIDTRLAGPGQLTSKCIGPNKLTYCEMYDHRDGTYTLCIRPTEVGKHTLVVKYGEDHVEGSPFTLYISNPPEPNKVRVYGPGVENGILSRFKSNFVVETKGAGAGQLTVRVRGPRGAFNVEMQRERKQDRTIHCKYEPREPGDYQIEVKWAGEHVPGSPFLIMIFDTQQELERYMSGQPPSPTPVAPFLPPGWVGPPPPGMFMGPPPGPPMLPLPPPPGPNFPQHGVPYASSTLYSNRSSKHKYLAANGYN